MQIPSLLLPFFLAAWSPPGQAPQQPDPDPANERDVCRFPTAGTAVAPPAEQGLSHEIAAWSSMAGVPVHCTSGVPAAPAPAQNPAQTLDNAVQGFHSLVEQVSEHWSPEQRPQGVTPQEKARVLSQAAGLVVQAAEQAGPEHPVVRRMMDTMDLLSLFIAESPQPQDQAPARPRRPPGGGPPTQEVLAAVLAPVQRPNPATLQRQEGPLSAIAEEVPQNPIPREVLGQGFFEQGRYPEAVEQLGKAIDLGSREADVFFLRGAAQEKLGNYAAAFRDAAAALALNPRHLRALTLYKLTQGRGDSRPPDQVQTADPNAVYIGRDDHLALSPRMAASGPLANAVADAPRSAPEPGLLKTAAAALSAGDARQALRRSSQAVTLYPQNSSARYLRAAAQLKLKNYAAAVQDATWVLGRVPDHVATLNIRALAFNHMGQFHRALDDVQAALRSRPANAVAYRNKAFAEAGLHRRARALDSLGTAARLSPAFEPEYRAARDLPDDRDILSLFVERAQGEVILDAPAAPARAPKKLQTYWLFLIAWFGGAIATLWVFQLTLKSWMHANDPARRRPLAQTPGKAPAASPAPSSAKPFHDRYEIVRVVGSGGMGVVYEALDRGLMRKVAIKKMRGEIRAEARAKERFLSEARTVASLRHPNIVEIYSIEEDAGDIFLVFEYLEAATLQEIIQKKKRLELAEAVKLFRSVCKALEYAHRLNVIHRDLKPLNIMVDKAGSPKIMDFGFARHIQESMNGKLLTSRAYGTWRYMAPEQERGGVCKESDLYALGVTLYEALTGRSPFPGEREEAQKGKLVMDFAPVQRLVPGLPAGLDDLFRRALDPDPRKRFHTPCEFFNELAAVVSRSTDIPVHPLVA